MFQGIYKGREVLMSCPVNIFTEVTIFETDNTQLKYKHDKSNRFLQNLMKKWGLSEFEKNIDFKIKSNIPMEKGFAASTADLCGIYYSAISLFNRPFNESELIGECIKIEPTDSILFKEMTIFDYKSGNFIEKIGDYFKLYLLVFEGRRTINTVDFNKSLKPPLSSIDDIVDNFKYYYKNNKANTMLKTCTESIIRNQNRLYYEVLSEVEKIKANTDGLAVIGAHSGDMLAVVYESSKKLNDALEKITPIKGYINYKLETLTRSEMCDYINWGNDYETRR